MATTRTCVLAAAVFTMWAAACGGSDSVTDDGGEGGEPGVAGSGGEGARAPGGGAAGDAGASGSGPGSGAGEGGGAGAAPSAPGDPGSSGSSSSSGGTGTAGSGASGGGTGGSEQGGGSTDRLCAPGRSCGGLHQCIDECFTDDCCYLACWCEADTLECYLECQ